MATLDIILSSQRVVTVQPVPRAVLSALEKQMLEIQSIWIEEGFSTADAIARADCWGHMQTVAAMLPNYENPAVLGFHLDMISNDYEQIERLFFGDTSSAYKRDFADQEAAIANFNISLFQGCEIWHLHRFEPKKKLMQASVLRERRSREKSQAEDLPQKTSQSKPVELKRPTRSPTSSMALERKRA